MSKQILMVSLMALAFSSGVFAKLTFETNFASGKRDWTTRSENNSKMSFVGVPANVRYVGSAREGKRALSFSPVSTFRRSEFVMNNGTGRYDFGKEYWSGISFKIIKPLSGNPKTGKGNFGVIFQHHSVSNKYPKGSELSKKHGGTYTPNGFAITAHNGGLQAHTLSLPGNKQAILDSPGGALRYMKTHKLLGGKKYVLNKWYDMVLHFKYSIHNDGFFEVWLNGVRAVSVKNQPTALEWGVYSTEKRKATNKSGTTPVPSKNLVLKQKTYNFLKFGMYYGNTYKNGEVAYDSIRFGDASSSYNEVKPRGGGSTPIPPIKYACNKGQKKTSSCSIQYASSANITRTCNSARTAFVGGSCSLIKCLKNSSLYKYTKSGNKCLRTAVVVVSPPVKPPVSKDSISITSHKGGKTSITVGQSIAMKVNAKAASGIKRVVFYNGSKFLYKDVVAPYEFTFKGLSKGTHNLKAIMVAVKNAAQTVAPLLVTVRAKQTNDTAPPVISAIESSVQKKSAVVSYNTNKLADQFINYGLTKKMGTIARSYAPLLLSHSFRVNA